MNGQDNGSDYRKQLDELQRRVSVLEQKKQEDLPSDSLDYHLWTIFFTVAFIIFSFVFSGDTQHYLRHISQAPVSLRPLRGSSKTLKLTVHSYPFLYQAPPKNIDIRAPIALDHISHDTFIKTLEDSLSLRFECNQNDQMAFSDYEVKILSDEVSIKIAAFPAACDSGKLARTIYIDVPSLPRGSFKIYSLESGVTIENCLPWIFKWSPVDSIFTWWVSVIIFLSFFAIFAYVVYFNIKTLFKYFFLFRDYADHIFRVVSFLKLPLKGQQTQTGPSESNLVQFLKEHRKYQNTSETTQSDVDGDITRYSFVLSPGRFVFWERVLSVVRSIQFTVFYKNGKWENTLTDPPREFLEKFKPIGSPFNKNFYNYLKWLTLTGWIYIPALVVIIGFTLLAYVITIRSSDIVLWVTVIAGGGSLLKDLLAPSFRNAVHILVKRKSKKNQA